MNMLARVLAAVRGTGIQPVNPRYEAPTWWGQFNVPADLFLTPDQQMAVSVAWACIRTIVDPIASSEVKVYQEAAGVREEDPEGWLWWLLNVEPHPAYTAQAWGELMGTRAVVHGNSYAYIQRDGARKPYSLQPLDPQRMRADEANGAIVYIYGDPESGEVTIPESEMIHIRGPMTGAFFGDSPLARSSAALALAKAQENYATSYYANGAFPGVLLKPPANRATPLTPEQKTGARTAWLSLFGGSKKAKGLGMLDPGWALEVVETDAQKSMVVEARKFQVAEILRYFGVPGHLVGIPESAQGYGKNLAELGMGFYRQTLEPWSRRIGEELRRKLMPARRQGGAWFIEHDLSRLTKGDEESVARADQMDLQNGVRTINEVRKARGLPSLPGGDTLMVQGVPLDRVINPPTPVAPDAPSDPANDPMNAAAAVLERHGRRAKARRADVEAKGGAADEVAKQLGRLRTQARVEVRAVGVKAATGAIDAALEAVEHGIEPLKVARHLAEAAHG